MSKNKVSTLDFARRLLESTEIAISSLIEEVKKPIDTESSGSARKAELQSVKMAIVDARELIQERQRLEEMIKSLEAGDDLGDDADFGAGFAEQFSKK